MHTVCIFVRISVQTIIHKHYMHTNMPCKRSRMSHGARVPSSIPKDLLGWLHTFTHSHTHMSSRAPECRTGRGRGATGTGFESRKFLLLRGDVCVTCGGLLDGALRALEAWTCVCICVYMCMHMHSIACVAQGSGVYIYIYIYIYVYMYTYTYTYIYIYIVKAWVCVCIQCIFATFLSLLCIYNWTCCFHRWYCSCIDRKSCTWRYKAMCF
jgi:hypothetical protein